MPVPTGRQSRIATVANHLKQRGHISEGSALIEYGRFRLADVIHRLRNERPDLLPPGMEIITINKHDTKGAQYGEYHLVTKKSEAVRARLAAVRAALNTTHGRLAYRDELSLHQSLVGSGN